MKTNNSIIKGIVRLISVAFLMVTGIENVWADATCTLSNANIVAGTTAASGYGSKSATDGCGNTWNAYALKNYHSNATISYHYLQIKAYASSTAYYIQVPTMPGVIKSISMVVSGASAPRGDGGNSNTLYFSASNNSSTAASGAAANPATAVSGTGSSSVTLNCEDLGLKGGYITANGAVRIWGDIVVTYIDGDAITLDKNNSDVSGSTSGSGMIAANATSLTSGFTPPTRTGYSVEGYYTTSGCTTKIATNLGALQPNITVDAKQWTNGSSQWKKGGTATFYTKWTPKTYTVTLNDNSGSGGSGSKTVTFNANTNMTSAVAIPTRTHYIFGGYWTSANSGATLDTKVIDSDGTWVAGVSGYTDATPNWIKADNVTLYAKWTEHTYTNYRTLCCTQYDITLASSGSKTGGTFEIDPTSACEGTEITLMATPDDGYEFSAWTITNDDDDDEDVTTTVLGSGNEDEDAVEFNMPAYNITIDATFSCIEPSISVQPSGNSYTQGEEATALSVTASAGTGTLGYQWQSSSDNSSWDNIDDEDGSTYTPPTSSTGTMYYRVVVTNTDCGTSTNSSSATIVVSAASVCATPTFSVAEGTYSSAQSVEISCKTDGATIRYTTDGTDPTESSSVYSSAISVSVNTTIKAKAFKGGMTASTVASATYNIRCAAPTFSLSEDIYVGSQTLTMSSATTGATVRYTTDESTPTGSSTAYSSALTVSTSTTYKAKAYKDGMTESEEAEVYIIIQCATPTFSVSGGTYNANQSVSISTTYGTTIHYTLDGNDPTTLSPTYSSALTIDASKTLKAIAVKDGCENSEVASATYTLKCATPTFSPIAGTYTGAQSVSMSCATTGSAIHYTTNGTDPTGSSATYSSAISVGTNQTVKAIATKTGWSDSDVASATYTIQYTVAVASVGNVTISATTPSILGGSSEVATYGSTVSLSYTSVASGKYWGGWNVYKTGDASTTVTVTSNQFTMPAYNVTVSAIIYGDAIAWCDPEIDVTDADIHLTSYNGVPVYTTSGANNLIEISSSDFGSATRLDVAYLDADNADAEVDKAESVFRFCSSSDYSTIDGIDLDYEWGTTHSIRYTPNAYNKRDNYKLQLILKRGDKVLKTVNRNIYGRALPQEFVIASKFNDEWYALPNTMGTATETVTPLKITVDNTTTPTAATYAPETTVYKGAARKTATSNRNSIRLTNDGSHWLITNNSNAQLGLSGTETEGYENREVWYLKSSDFGAYTLKMDPAMSPTKQLGIYGGNMGMYATPTSPSGAIYLLPITHKYTPMDATVHEWGEHGVIVSADMSDIDGVKVNVDAASPSAATLTAVNAASLTAGKYVKVDAGAMTIGAAANDGKMLYLHWMSGETEIGASQIQIPVVVAESKDMKTLIGAKETWAKKEVHVLPGVTLTANAGSFGSSAVTVPTMYIYPGATLNVSTGTLTATTLRLRNGWTRAGSKQYNSARVYIADDAALVKTTASIDYDIYEQSDGKHYYPLAVPFQTAVNSIDYVDAALATASVYGKHFAIKEYDGANRAANGEDSNANWDVVSESGNLVPGKGYIMTAVAVKGEAIIRVPLTFDNGWTSDGEKASYDAVTKNVIAVTAHSGAAATGHQRHAGWNMLGVPFMSCYGNVDDIYSGGGAATLINGDIVINTSNPDPFSYDNTTIPYVSVPSHDFAEYIQTDITEAELRPGWSFFVQVAESGNLTFAVNDRQTNDNSPLYAPRKHQEEEIIRTGIILSDGLSNDKTTLLISNNYSEEYEIGADLEKMFGSGYTLATYALSQGTRYAYYATDQATAQGPIPIGFRAPEAGSYTFSLNSRYATNRIERLELIDYQLSEVTNLLESSYTFTTDRTQDDSRFAIHAVVGERQTPTPVDAIEKDHENTNEPVKFIYRDKMYIMFNGVIYDATGKKVR